jgi:transcriptional regulator with XRE-family HTH domain
VARLMGVPRDRAVGGWLREMREETGLTAAAAAERMGWSGSKMSRIESGRHAVSIEDASALAALFGVKGDRRERLLALIRPVDELTCWWEPGLPGYPSECALSFHEVEATKIVQWASLTISEPLQTLDYARTTFAANGVPPEEMGEWLTGQQRRARLASGRLVPYMAYLSEVALRTPVGGLVRRQQLRHLLEVSQSVLVRVVRQVVPHAGLGGGWTMLHYGDTCRVARVELLGSSVYLNREGVRPYRAAETYLEGAALSLEQSRALIQSLIDQSVLLD